MSSSIDRRVRVLEGRQRDRHAQLTPEEQQAAVARLLADEGLTEHEAIEQLGSVPAFIHYLMCRPDPNYTPPPVGDIFEAYRIACRGPSKEAA